MKLFQNVKKSSLSSLYKHPKTDHSALSLNTSGLNKSGLSLKK